MQRSGLKFAVIFDVHLSYQPADQDCDPSKVRPPEERHDVFMTVAEQWGAELVINLGDLHPKSLETGPGAQVVQAWQAWPEQKIAVMGNHDDDYVDTADYLREMGMPSPFYSRVVNGWTFVVLYSGDPATPPGTPFDECDTDQNTEYLHESQLNWLEDKLIEAAGPCIVLVHNGVTSLEQLVPPPAFRSILNDVNAQSPDPKVIACFWGHKHRTAITQEAGVQYIMVNSANYRWDSDLGPLFYRDPPPFALGYLTDDELQLWGTGYPDNWAGAECSAFDESDLPADSETYQIGTEVGCPNGLAGADHLFHEEQH